MKNFLSKVPDSVRRLTVVFVVLIGAVFGIRSALPPALKDTKIHIQSTLEREMKRPVRHAGSNICGECHEQANVKKTGYHRNLACETCHGAAQDHVENPTEVKPETLRKRESCVRCHVYHQSRPTGFPQINPVVHNPLKACISCHNPHDPKPPHVPEQCQACHGEIARTKAVSPHALLDCTTCHVVPNQHRVAPRSVEASIPVNREFCGKCHAKDSRVKETPKVDLASHGEKYLCWQCHYPHMPEVE
jgi:hypothetical protein